MPSQKKKLWIFWKRIGPSNKKEVITKNFFHYSIRVKIESQIFLNRKRIVGKGISCLYDWVRKLYFKQTISKWNRNQIKFRDFILINYSVGWVGYTEEKRRELCRQALSDGYTRFKVILSIIEFKKSKKISRFSTFSK